MAIVIRAPNDAPDFDYQDRIQEAQALVAKQPVLKDDIQVDTRGQAFPFRLDAWRSAQKTGPLTLLRMDETGKERPGLHRHLAGGQFHQHAISTSKSPDGYIVFAQRRPVHGKDGYEEAVYTAYAPELDTKKMRDAGMDYLRHLQRLAYNQHRGP